jgi:hypothetical protein
MVASYLVGTYRFVTAAAATCLSVLGGSCKALTYGGKGRCIFVKGFR